MPHEESLRKESARLAGLIVVVRCTACKRYYLPQRQARLPLRRRAAAGAVPDDA